MFLGLSRIINRFVVDKTMSRLRERNFLLQKKLSVYDAEMERLARLIAAEASISQQLESELRVVSRKILTIHGFATPYCQSPLRRDELNGVSQSNIKNVNPRPLIHE